MTILISLMSDTFLSKFQKSAEKFGVKGEDERYQDIIAQSQEKEQRGESFPRRLFGRKAEKPQIGKDVERGDVVSTTNDEILREEVLEEVESIQEEVNEEVDSELGINKKDFAMVEEEMSADKGTDSPCVQNQDEDIDDERITEKDVELAMKENRMTGH